MHLAPWARFGSQSLALAAELRPGNAGTQKQLRGPTRCPSGPCHIHGQRLLLDATWLHRLVD
eukprot:8083978-Alexandrium_andersonii.AAC.1